MPRINEKIGDGSRVCVRVLIKLYGAVMILDRFRYLASDQERVGVREMPLGSEMVPNPKFNPISYPTQTQLLPDLTLGDPKRRVVLEDPDVALSSFYSDDSNRQSNP